MPEDEQGGGGEGAGQGSEGGGGQVDKPADDPGPFKLGYQVRHRDPAGFTRKAALERPEPEPDTSTTTPDPDDPGEFNLTDLTEEERRRPNP